MARSTGQKLKLLYLRDILLEHTDENHALTTGELISLLAQKGVSADRKTLYADIEMLNVEYDFDVQKTPNNRAYFTIDRPFELPELKLLIDSVQSSKFISENKTIELLDKIKKLCSKHTAHLLGRQVVLRNRVKNMSKGNVLYTVDALHAAIAADRQITFRYFDYGVKKQQKKRGQFTQSPFALIYTDDNYYLFAYDARARKFKHFRVDKMLDVKETQDAREGKDEFQQIDLGTYTKQTFGMFGGDMEKVTMEFANSLAGVVIDRFGYDVWISPTDDKHFEISVPVAVSDLFLAWVVGFGNRARIVGPASVVDRMKELLKTVSTCYEGKV